MSALSRVEPMHTAEGYYWGLHRQLELLRERRSTIEGARRRSRRRFRWEVALLLSELLLAAVVGVGGALYGEMPLGLRFALFTVGAIGMLVVGEQLEGAIVAYRGRLDWRRGELRRLDREIARLERELRHS